MNKVWFFGCRYIGIDSDEERIWGPYYSEGCAYRALEVYLRNPSRKWDTAEDWKIWSEDVRKESVELEPEPHRIYVPYEEEDDD